MSPDEALKVCRFAKALSPAQAIDEYQPEAWSLVLRNIRYVDATDALEKLGGEQEWIHVSHIVKRVKKIRQQRVADFGVLPDPPPGHDPDDVEGHNRYLADITRRIADGEDVVSPQQPASIRRDVIAELGTVGLDPEVAYDARAAIAAARDLKAAAEAEARTARDARIAERAVAKKADREARHAAKPEMETAR